MKATFTTSLKTILADRLLTVLLVVFLLACIAYCIYVGVSLQPSDLQVAIHYTAYGETNFYREKWYYLLSFIAFGLIVAVMHSVLATKIYLQGRRPLAILFLGLSFLVILIAWFITWSVLKIAFL
jgi:hypothetical protein